ncbi:hypothetical protein NDA01_26810 [Trichocoleus desertorum AS-A10]|uniref:hypothetical protein n=1 Tax=Trichocoleus desertorum TaxID=1481672 RepID=UPI003299D638
MSVLAAIAPLPLTFSQLGNATKRVNCGAIAKSLTAQAIIAARAGTETARF